MRLAGRTGEIRNAMTRPTTRHWTTGITAIADSSIRYRGRPVEDLIGDASFEQVVCSLLLGTEDPEVLEVVRRTLVAAADHGVAAPSIATTRIVASTQTPVAAAVAAGLVAFAGPAHGGAAEACGSFIASIAAVVGDAAEIPDAVADAVDTTLAGGERIPGFGHPVHRADPRVPPLLATPLARNIHRDIARSVEAVLVARRSPRLTMNADAAVAALFLDAGLEPADVSAVTAIGRVVGLTAHAREEQRREQPFRAPSPDDITYDGP
jgi:citrate synthase